MPTFTAAKLKGFTVMPENHRTNCCTSTNQSKISKYISLANIFTSEMPNGL